MPKGVKRRTNPAKTRMMTRIKTRQDAVEEQIDDEDLLNEQLAAM
jgi:hypothetical protein